MSFSGIESEFKRLRAEVEKFENAAVQDVHDTTIYLLEQLMARTPVWEGTTVRNYNVSTRGYSSAYSEPIGAGDPGPTNYMSIGSEPRRPANENAAISAARSVLSFKKLMDVFVNNTSPHADLIDAGEAPGGPGQRIRNPGGVLTLAIQATRAGRKNWR